MTWKEEKKNFCLVIATTMSHKNTVSVLTHYLWKQKKFIAKRISFSLFIFLCHHWRRNIVDGGDRSFIFYCCWWCQVKIICAKKNLNKKMKTSRKSIHENSGWNGKFSLRENGHEYLNMSDRGVTRNFFGGSNFFALFIFLFCSFVI